MALSSHERRVLEEIELDLRSESPELDRLLSSMSNIQPRQDGASEDPLVGVWKEAATSVSTTFVGLLKRIPRAVYVCAVVGFIALLVSLASSGGSGTPPPQACEHAASGNAPMAAQANGPAAFQPGGHHVSAGTPGDPGDTVPGTAECGS